MIVIIILTRTDCRSQWGRKVQDPVEEQTRQRSEVSRSFEAVLVMLEFNVLPFVILVMLVSNIWPFDIDMMIFVKIFALMHFFSSADEPCWGFPARSIQVLIKSYYMFWNLIEFFQTQFVKIEGKQWFSAICSLLWYDISNLLFEQRPIIGKYTLAVTFIKVKNFSWAKH